MMLLILSMSSDLISHKISVSSKSGFGGMVK